MDDLKGYVLLSNIYKEFKVTRQTVTQILNKMGAEKKRGLNNCVYIKEDYYTQLRNKLSMSNRVKAIKEINDNPTQENQEHEKEKIFELTIEHLQDKVSLLEKQLLFKDQEISSFHNIVSSKEKEIKQLNNNLLLAEQTKEDLKQKENELQIIKEREQKLQKELIEERKSKCVVVEELNNLKNKSLFGRVVAAIKGF
ncbi:hypothetical protein ACSW82_16520 (plasmid) [Clostridium perfringens]